MTPFRDDRDIDNNNVTGVLNYDQTKSLLTNLSYNMTIFDLGEQFHNLLDPQFSQTNGAKVYEIIGTAQPTLGQIHETWWITWPVNLIPKVDEIFINGDGTVPLYSASLKNDSIDISGAINIYYVEQEHSNLVSSNGTAMQTVKAILNDDNALPIEVKALKIDLEGEQISLDDGQLNLYDDQNRHCGLNDNGEIEENIPNVTCTTSGNTKHAFVKKKASKVKVRATRKQKATASKTTSIKKRTYRQDKISKTTLYKDITIGENGKIEFDLDTSADTSPALNYYPDSTLESYMPINPTSEVSGDAAFDQAPPTTLVQISGTKDASGIYNGPVTIVLTGNDSGAGILRIEYSLDNGETIHIYSEPITISTSGRTTLQVKSIDKSGNEEIPQTIVIEIAVPATPTPAPSSFNSGSSSNSSSDSSSSSNSDSSSVIPSNSETSLGSNLEIATSLVSIAPRNDTISNSSILGVNFENPSHISDEINVSHLLDKKEILNPKNIAETSAKQILGGLLLISGGITALASLGLMATFHPSIIRPKGELQSTSILKPFPKEM